MFLGTCREIGLLAALLPILVQAPMWMAKGSLLPTLIFLFGGHALCDYPWQGEFLALGKNRHGNPGSGWFKAMFAHCSIHAAMVLAITGSAGLALAEFVIHFATDCAKCEGWIDSDLDQAIHYACKIAWGIIVWRGR